MPLIEITEESHDVILDLAYATPRNLTGRPIYARAACYLHPDACRRLEQAIALARPLGLKLKLFDAFRPTDAQWALWNFRPDPEFLADPRVGSPHSRGVAVDLTLVGASGAALDMGTGFDAFTPLSHHANTDIAPEPQANRLLLLGLMTAAGWDFYANEWWHYQLLKASSYPLIADGAEAPPMMG
ncbi:MAG TPA: D-alanyl-D-alanine dipeptidase [Stellaceae bacterium]|nr:D-alanyl-D-alanine dipeptidase [Stellaceae bacterium]